MDRSVCCVVEKKCAVVNTYWGVNELNLAHHMGKLHSCVCVWEEGEGETRRQKTR